MFQSTTTRYLAGGAIFGLMFPLVATVGLSIEHDQSLVTAQLNGGWLLWIIDSAPFVLGLFGYLIGKKQFRLEQIKDNQQATIDEALKVQRRMFASINHELRNAINGVIGLSEYLEEELTSNELQQYQLIAKKIGLSGQHALEITNDVLTSAKLESGQFQMKPCIFRLSTTLTVVEDVARSFEKKFGNRFINSNRQDYLLESDPLRLKQILINLISNAMKFTQNGTVELETVQHRDQGTLSISIKDTGRGIPQDKINDIFDLYSQVDGSDQTMGTGLGLSIVKTLLQQMNGSIHVTSEVGKGSTFTINIPCMDAFEDSKTSEEFYILLVDDDEDFRYSLGQWLQEEGLEVVLAGSGQEALTIAKARRPGIVVSDLVMPGMNGKKFIMALRGMYPDLDAVMIMTGSFSPNIENEFDFPIISLSKPFPAGDFIEKIKKISSNLKVKKSA